MIRKFEGKFRVPAPELGNKMTRTYEGELDVYTKTDVIPVKLDNDAICPARAHVPDAGADLYAREDKWIWPWGSAVFDTGVHMAIPYGYVGELEPKSGLNVNHNLVGWGTIDSGYTGSIRVKLYNLGWKPHKVHKGDKISQIVIYPVELCGFGQVETLEETERGDGGFGSTGR